ncbi:MAG: hypothetical protein KGZ89_09215 [Actinobacteria bacterium]|nr:hypothetical protein [Actinomycetota bacterium]
MPVVSESGEPDGQRPHCLSLSCRRRPGRQELVLRLIEELGFDGIDSGSLVESWRQQPGAPAYCRDLDCAALSAALSEPDAIGIAQRRRVADEQARPFFEASSADSPAR